MEKKRRVPPANPVNPCKPAERRLGLETLKDSTRALIEACGGLEAAATLTRVGKTELGNYQSPSQPTRCIPIDVAFDLMTASRRLELLEDLAALLGCLVVPQESEGAGFNQDIAHLAEQTAATFRDYALALEQDAISYEDRRRLDRDLARVIEAAMDAREHLRREAAALHCCANP